MLAVEVDGVSKGHELFRIDVNAPLFTSCLVGFDVHVYSCILSHFETTERKLAITNARFGPIWLQYEIFLQFVRRFVDIVLVVTGVIKQLVLDI